MRRLHRCNLPFETRTLLHRHSHAVTCSDQARTQWARFRATIGFKPIENALVTMSGPRQRCAYCSDSHASDIDHFCPIALDHSRAFDWINMLWVCSRCNRIKGSRFPVNQLGEPLLVDPTSIDPWSKLTLDTRSGIISARYHDDVFDSMGDATLEILPTINYEAVTEGRLRVVRQLLHAFDEVTRNGDTSKGRERLATCVREDDMGISRWFGFWDGQHEDSAMELKSSRPILWRRFLRMCAD